MAFLDGFSFKTLLAPETEETFITRHWERAPLVVHRNDPQYYGDLFTLADFDREMAQSPRAIHTASAITKRHTRHEDKGSQRLQRVMAEMRDGATLLLNSLHLRHAKLGLLCRLLKQELGHGFSANCYLTPPDGRGFTPHWDNGDSFILQLQGHKHWRIEKRRRYFPDSDENMPEN